MNSQISNFKLAFDVMGADNSYDEAIKAAIEMIKLTDNLIIYLVGDKFKIAKILGENNWKYWQNKIKIEPAEEIINMEDELFALIKKKNSSLMKAVNLLVTKKVNALVSAGSTKNLIAAIHLFLKHSKLIPEIALMPIFPTKKDQKKLLLLDVGANLTNNSNDLLNFGIVANVYSKLLFDIKSPKIALLNIGHEANKGRELEKTTYQLLKNKFGDNFVGNIEARYVLEGDVDVIVCDGYSGNICLKSLEGLGHLLFKLFKLEFKRSNLLQKICFFINKKIFYKIKNKFDYNSVGAAQIVGIDELVVKVHGNAKKNSYLQALQLTLKLLNNNIIQKIKSELR